jgi:DNA-binding MarR family transcriptional regulator
MSMAGAGQHTSADLAREHGLTTSAIARLIDRLGKKGLVSRRHSSSDQRVVVLSLTPEGQHCSDQLPAIFTEAMKDLLADFTNTEIGHFQSMLGRILSTAEQAIPPQRR